MLKLLFISNDTSLFLNRNYYFLERELAKLCDLMVWRHSGEISEILKQIPKKPDFILILNDIGSQLNPLVTGLANTDIPSGLIVNDAHRFREKRRNFIEDNKIRTFFVVGKEPFFKHYPEYKQHHVFLLPHHVNTSIYKDYGLKKDIDFMMLGSVDTAYPLRMAINRHYKNDSRFVTHSHPGFRNFSKEQEQKQLIGENYARELNRAKVFFTCGSSRNYAVIKYFEVPACNTLLLAPAFPDLEEMGFIPGKHFVDINRRNFAEKAEYYLKNKKEREKITEEGYRFIQNNHSTVHRAAQLIQQINKIV